MRGCVLLVLLQLAGLTLCAEMKGPPCGFGLFFHFHNCGEWDIPGMQRSSEQWNLVCDSLDVCALARQCHEIGAQYAFITTGQGSGYYCAPNQTMERLVRRADGKSRCSRRDVVSDFADALAVYGIECWAYSIGHCPGFDPELTRQLKGSPPWLPYYAEDAECRALAGADPYLADWQNAWYAIHREWSLRWGGKVRGWWIDGCYNAERYLIRKEHPNHEDFHDALLAGNPDGAVAFNSGVRYPLLSDVRLKQEFTAGESPDPLLAVDERGHGAFGKLKYHVLTYAGRTWAHGPLRGDADYFASATWSIVSAGGACSWDIPFWTNGIARTDMKTMLEFGRRYRRYQREFPILKTRLESPAVGPDGRERPGTLSVFTDRPIDLTYEYEGACHDMKNVTSLEIPIPVSRNRRAEVRLMYRDMTRRIPIIVRRLQPLTGKGAAGDIVDFHDPARKLASVRMSRANDRIRFALRAYTETRRAARNPWQGDCTEIFLATNDDDVMHLCIRADGTTRMFPHYTGGEQEISGDAWSFEQMSDGYRFEFVLPVKRIVPGYCGKLRYSVQQRGRIGGKDCFGSWCGTDADPLYFFEDAE